MIARYSSSAAFKRFASFRCYRIWKTNRKGPPIGEIALLDPDGSRSVPVIAIADTIVARFDHSQFEALACAAQSASSCGGPGAGLRVRHQSYECHGTSLYPCPAVPPDQFGRLSATEPAEFGQTRQQRSAQNCRCRVRWLGSILDQLKLELHSCNSKRSLIRPLRRDIGEKPLFVWRLEWHPKCCPIRMLHPVGLEYYW